MPVIVTAVLLGMAALLAGTLPRNLVFIANLHYYTGIPWSVPVLAVYLWVFWNYLRGCGPPPETAALRRSSLRARGLPVRVWCWALAAGGLGIIALVAALRILNRVLELPVQQPPDLAQIPAWTMASLLVMSSLFAGVVEEAAFRGYMQGPMERRHGPVIAILITGTMFAVAHLDFTLILWPYYLAVAAIYGSITFLTDSILPAVVLHTCGNLYSNFDLWLYGQAEWQSGPGAPPLRDGGIDASLLLTGAVFIVSTMLMLLAYRRLARETARLPHHE